MDPIEERLAHLIRANDDLSDEVARQAKVIERLTKQVAMLMDRARAEAEEGEGGAVFGDERPPHW